MQAPIRQTLQRLAGGKTRTIEEKQQTDCKFDSNGKALGKRASGGRDEREHRGEDDAEEQGVNTAKKTWHAHMIATQATPGRPRKQQFYIDAFSVSPSSVSCVGVSGFCVGPETAEPSIMLKTEPWPVQRTVSPSTLVIFWP